MASNLTSYGICLLIVGTMLFTMLLIFGFSYSSSQPHYWYAQVTAIGNSSNLENAHLYSSPVYDDMNNGLNPKLLTLFDPSASTDHSPTPDIVTYVFVPQSCNVTIGQVVELSNQYSYLGYGQSVPVYVLGR